MFTRYSRHGAPRVERDAAFMPLEKARTGETSQVPPSPSYPAKSAPPGRIEPLELAQEISEQFGPHADGLSTCEPRTQPRQNGVTDGLRLASVADCPSNLREMRPELSRAEVQRVRDLASRHSIAAKPPLAPFERKIFRSRGTQR